MNNEHAGAKGYDVMPDYGLTKLIGTSWMKHLSEAHGLRALTVSPGMTSGTAGIDKAPPFMRFMFAWILMPVMKLLGNAHNVDVGAARYVQGLEDRSLSAGGFYASAPNAISGPLVEQTAAQQPLLADDAFHAAVARLITRQVSEAAGTPTLRAVG